MGAKALFRCDPTVGTLLAGGFLLAAVLVAHAQLAPLGDEFQVNTYTTGFQDSPSVAAEGNGSFVVVWGDAGYYVDGQDGSESGIRGQRFDAAGAPEGVEFQVNAYTTGPQQLAEVASDRAGNFVVVWENWGDLSGPPNVEIVGQRFDSSGTPQGPEFAVNTHTPDDQLRPAVAADPAGNFVVVWQSYSQDAYAGFGIFGQRFDSTGNPVGTEFQVNTYTTEYQTYPAVAMDAGGNFVVAWESYAAVYTYPEENQDGSGRGVFAQRFDNSGAPQGAEFQVNTYTTGSQSRAAVAADALGNFLIAWRSPQDGDGTGIFGQRFDAGGTPQGGEFQINTYTTGDQGVGLDRTIAVASDPGGSFLVTWHSMDQDGSDRGIFGQHYDATGAPRDGEFQINTYVTGAQAGPSVTSTAAGEFVVTWYSRDQDGDGNGVFGQRLTQVTPPALLGGKKLLLKDAPAKPQKRRLLLVSKDPGVTVGDGPGSGDDPTIHGATLRVLSTAGDNFDDTYALESANWKPIKRKDPAKGWKFTKGDPIKKVLIKAGKLIKVIGKGSGLGHSLGTNPDPVDVVLTVGARAFCFQFGGAVKFRDGKRFLGTVAGAPSGCPPTGSPSGAFLE